MAVKVTADNFDLEVKQAKEVVLLDFWASWCAPCNMIAPTLDEIHEDQNNIKVCKVNVDEEMVLANEFGIVSIPTILVFKNGEQVAKSIGVSSKEELLNLAK